MAEGPCQLPESTPRLRHVRATRHCGGSRHPAPWRPETVLAPIQLAAPLHPLPFQPQAITGEADVNRAHRLYEYQGRMLSSGAISKLTGIPAATIILRGKAGLPVDQPRKR